MSDYPHYLSPLTIRGKTWKNRSVAAPMGGVDAADGKLTDYARYFIDFYTQGDVAEYIIGETDINPVGSRAPEGHYFDIQAETSRAALREAVDRIHSHDVLAMIELCHCGATKRAGPNAEVWGPSEFVRESDGVRVHGMTEEEILSTIEDFTSAAVAAKDCGVDGIVIHAGHEWLPHQFMSMRTNHRTDRFGGSVENRIRFLVMTADAIRTACGEEFIIECRVSGAENCPDDPGYTLEESCAIFSVLSDHIDILHVSAGRYYEPVDSQMMSCMYQPHGLNVPAAAEIKKHVSCIVSVVGGFCDPVMCEEVIASGKADLIVMGRQRLADPLLVKKAAEGRSDEIRRCIRCMRCFPGPMEHVMAEMMANAPAGDAPPPPGPGSGELTGDVLPVILEQLSHCTVNPQYKYGAPDSHPAPERIKKVLVVGGGCAGMQAAITAKERGHDVTLIEKSDRLGGILNFAEFDENKQDLTHLARAMEAELTRLNVDVCLETEFTPAYLRALAPDAVIVAVGSRVTDRGVPGMDGPNVLSAMEAYQEHMAFGNHAVVIGGGQTGCETAKHIARTGTRVTLVAKHETLAQDAYRLHGIQLRKLLAQRNVEVLKNTVCTEVRRDGVLVKNTKTGERKLIEADCTVNALGMEPVPCGEIEAACEGLEFYKIGDCVKARNICDALEEGYLTALKL